ncbi:Zn(II)2Cys6 transcription factor domain-containing protein [Aspergillus lucknowensis]|uniref:Zn(2)-C6 fungal-type domain-containing protein n=1 Tax=Aspergillus lucknowensis TaxID=176173 RepID=A0ABR4LGB3_9EURO
MLSRQERKSCELCRARKLRCSGEKSGCSRCRSLSLTCRFKDKGAPGRPRKRAVRQETSGVTEGSSISSLSSGSTSHASSIVPVPQMALDPVIMGAGDFDSFPSELAANCGFDSLALPRGMLFGDGDACGLPIEAWQMPQESEIPLPSLDANSYLSPVSTSRLCKCDEEVSSIIRSLSRAGMSHDIIQTLRAGVSLTERLLTCPVCYDVSRPPRVTVQNVLLIGHLMFEVTSGYRKYVRWLKDHDSDSDKDAATDERKTVYFDSGLGGIDLQISNDKLKDLIIHGLENDVERLLEFGKKFAQRQRNRHDVGHETCPDPDGRCRRNQDGSDRDPLDICPHHPVARGLIPCFRIVDEVQGMIQQVVDVVCDTR